ncbi:carboxypeptidase regulatory-like domain-containing protein [Spirosoma fluviale]|uniref:WD40-like Beta Propeller Repeat n=1 Tax=Spirosoma fluviale TaxID=1597977 RepID=A0A286G009_9BACT|nr:carboxypeptidase regulatory-like domain-containing protein [Spirosoma fluviale]SOD88860.1 WD40-like Beta Propeller Repeat [Spirosoma fluviale]
MNNPYFFVRRLVGWLNLLAIVSLLGSCTETTFVDVQTFGSVRGQVLLGTTRQPVQKALVRLSPSGQLIETDADGRFRFDSLPPTRYTVTVTKERYATELATVDATVSYVSVLTILMRDDKSQNSPPTAPTVVSPAPGSTTVTTTVTLKWAATDPNRDTLTYQVKLYKAGDITNVLSFTGLTADSLALSSLAYNTTYYWHITVSDGVSTTNGPVWSFRTMPFSAYSYVFCRRVSGMYQLFSGNGNKQPVQQLTTEGSNWRPIVSPNRQQIAFISNRDSEPHLYLMDQDGSHVRQVTDVPIGGLSGTDLSFCWSPDGTELVYPSYEHLYAVRTDGTGLRTIAKAPNGRLFAGCDWSSQSNQLIARTTSGNLYNNELILISASGTTQKLLLARPANRIGNPVFSLDGTQALFAMDASIFQNAKGRQLDSRIHRLNVATGVVSDLSLDSGNLLNTNKPTGTNDLDPRYSPTGGKIIFINSENTDQGTSSIMTMALDGTGRTVLFSVGEMPYWQ